MQTPRFPMQVGVKGVLAAWIPYRKAGSVPSILPNIQLFLQVV